MNPVDAFDANGARGNATRGFSQGQLTEYGQFVFPRIVIIRFDHVYSAHRK
jgi:hypothetical protein